MIPIGNIELSKNDPFRDSFRLDRSALDTVRAQEGVLARGFETGSLAAALGGIDRFKQDALGFNGLASSVDKLSKTQQAALGLSGLAGGVGGSLGDRASVTRDPFRIGDLASGLASQVETTPDYLGFANSAAGAVNTGRDPFGLHSSAASLATTASSAYRDDVVTASVARTVRDPFAIGATAASAAAQVRSTSDAILHSGHVASAATSVLSIAAALAQAESRLASAGHFAASPPWYEARTPRLAPPVTPAVAPVRRAAATPLAEVAELGEQIRAARKALDLNQQEFADLAGVGRRFVSELEGGKESLEIGKVLACCQAAGIDLLVSPRRLA